MYDMFQTNPYKNTALYIPGAYFPKHFQPLGNCLKIIILVFFKFYLLVFFQKQLHYFNYSYITYITATENNLQYSYIYNYITYVFCFLQIRMLQCNTIFKTILVEERLNKLLCFLKEMKRKNKDVTVYRVHYLQFIIIYNK